MNSRITDCTSQTKTRSQKGSDGILFNLQSAACPPPITGDKSPGESSGVSLSLSLPPFQSWSSALHSAASPSQTQKQAPNLCSAAPTRPDQSVKRSCNNTALCSGGVGGAGVRGRGVGGGGEKAGNQRVTSSIYTPHLPPLCSHNALAASQHATASSVEDTQGIQETDCYSL